MGKGNNNNQMEKSGNNWLSDISDKTRKNIKYPIGGFAPGGYIKKCAWCMENFMGDKYSRECEPCAINALSESYKLLLEKSKKMETELRRIKAAAKIIKALAE